MTTPTWPEQLPGFDDNMQGEFQQGFERTPMQYGGAKQNRLFSRISKFYRGTMTMTSDQSAIFDAFYENTILQAGEFMFADPRTKQMVKVRFEVRPTFTVRASHDPDTGESDPISIYNISLEKLP